MRRSGLRPAWIRAARTWAMERERKSGRHSRAMGALWSHLLQGNFKHLGTLASQGPAPHPATVVPVVHTDHLVELLVGVKPHTLTLAGQVLAGAGTGKGCHARGSQMGRDGRDRGRGGEGWEGADAGLGRKACRCAQLSAKGAGPIGEKTFARIRKMGWVWGSSQVRRRGTGRLHARSRGPGAGAWELCSGLGRSAAGGRDGGKQVLRLSFAVASVCLVPGPER